MGSEALAFEPLDEADGLRIGDLVSSKGIRRATVKAIFRLQVRGRPRIRVRIAFMVDGRPLETHRDADELVPLERPEPRLF